MKGNLKEKIKGKNFRLGTYTMTASVIVIVIAVIVNMCVNALPSKITEIDLSSNNIYSIGEQTKTVVKSLEEKVNIYWIVQDGYEDVYVEKMLANYEDLNKNVIIEKIDPVIYPNFASQYTSASLYNNSLIVTNSDESKSRYLSYYDIYKTTYDENYNEFTEFNGEGVLTAAIKYVSSDEQTTLYYLTGHGELDIPSNLQNSIHMENMEIKELNLLMKGEIPADCQALIVYSPASDLSSDDVKIVEEYLQAGGKMLLFTDCTEKDQTNLYAMMENYGVSAVNGLIVENDSNYCLYNYANYIVPSIQYHDITSPLVNSNYFIVMPFAHGLQITDDGSNENLKITSLLETSDDAFAKKAGFNATNADFEEGDIESEDGFVLAAAITETVENGETKIVWISDSYMTDSQMDELTSGANTDFVINSLGWLCELEDSVTIRAKSISYDYLTLTAAQSNMLSTIVIFIIPLAFIVIGVAVWIKRRKM